MAPGDRAGRPAASLDNVANAARARGDLVAAERLFTESLEISRKLALEHDTPEARRDLAIACLNLATMALSRGDGAVRRAAAHFGRVGLENATPSPGQRPQTLATQTKTE